ncbi:hypothetical protein Pr1d_51280 [Bythopirellula goksoeyrii]|uniref:Uncharacterized protein n=1 Tax=Bythopirellula goksoeyrii TaxID=1400387 RepID=A0A5B9QUP3_9BACT|nr:hypothetical protein Pr1d_51280 [Bythopirellula goksoeyrii]
MPRSLLATFVSILIGGVVAFVVIVFVLEGLHTKHTFPNLIGFVAGAGLGCLIALKIRRSLLAPKTHSYRPFTNEREPQDDVK